MFWVKSIPLCWLSQTFSGNKVVLFFFPWNTLKIIIIIINYNSDFFFRSFISSAWSNYERMRFDLKEVCWICCKILFLKFCPGTGSLSSILSHIAKHSQLMPLWLMSFIRCQECLGKPTWLSLKQKYSWDVLNIRQTGPLEMSYI